jgi:hypothetical protein
MRLESCSYRVSLSWPIEAASVTCLVPSFAEPPHSDGLQWGLAVLRTNIPARLSSKASSGLRKTSEPACSGLLRAIVSSASATSIAISLLLMKSSVQRQAFVLYRVFPARLSAATTLHCRDDCHMPHAPPKGAI